MKIRYSAGKIIETTKGDYTLHFKKDIVENAQKIIETAEQGIVFGEPDPFPEIDKPEALGNVIIQCLPLLRHGEDENYHADTDKVVYNGEVLSIYNGEFGYDWYQQKHDTATSINIEEALVTGVKSYGGKDKYDIETYADKAETLEAFRSQYKQIKTNRTYPRAQGKYYVPYLALFSKETADQQLKEKGHIQGFSPPPYTARLRLCLDIENPTQKPLKLEIKGNPYYKINDAELGQSFSINYSELKIQWGEVRNLVLKLECIQPYSTMQEIDILVHYPVKLTPIPQLAGRILAIPNNDSFIKRQKIALIETKIDTLGNGNIKTGTFSAEVKKCLRYLYQALILPEWTTIELDLTQNLDFKLGSTIITPNGQAVVNSIETHIKLEEAFERKDQVEKWKEHVYVFGLALPADDPILGGSSPSAGSNRVMLFHKTLLLARKGDNLEQITLSHEIFHALGIGHTFTDEQESQRRFDYRKKFILDRGATDNIMGYNTTRTTTFLWQWQIANPNLKNI